MLLRLGEIETELNDYAAAEAHLADAMRRLMRLEDSLGIAQGKYLYGRIKTEQAQNDEALTLFTDAKRIFEEEENWLGIAKNLNLMAFCHMKLSSDYQTAHALLEQSISLQRQMPLSSTYIESLRNLARIKINLGDYASAEGCLVEATTISLKQQDIGEYAAVLFERTILCRRQDQIDAALHFGCESLDHFRRLGSLRWEGLVKMQLAILHQAKENFEQALSLFHDSQQLFEHLGDMHEQAYAYCFLYKLYDKIGKREQSRLSKQQAVQLNTILNDPELAKRLE